MRITHKAICYGIHTWRARRVERWFGLDGIEAFQRWSNAVIIGRHDPEEVLLTFRQTLGDEGRVFAEGGNGNPVIMRDVATFDDVVRDLHASVELGWMPSKSAHVFIDVSHV